MTGTKSKIIIAVKVILFILIFALLFSGVSHIVTVSSTNMEFQWMAGIYEEPKDSLDAVYIGSSSCYAFWNPVTAWDEYGIAVYPYACSSQPLVVAEYLIKEARKTQKDALYVVNINTLNTLTSTDTEGYADTEEAEEAQKLAMVVRHRLLDYMPMSLNKLELIDYVCDLDKLEPADRLEYYLPIVRYHSKWGELTEYNFSDEINDTKGADTYSWFLGSYGDITGGYHTTDEQGEISDEVESALLSLMDYCEEEDVKVLFVVAPRGEGDVEVVKKLNTVSHMLRERGFDVLDLIGKTEEIGLDTTCDYYNKTHTNIHGAIKYTHYMGNYLAENYGFEDKRGEKEYKSWDEAVEIYKEILVEYVPDFEFNYGKRDYSLAIPEMTLTRTPEKVNISWQAVEGADGYEIYRKPSSTCRWKYAGETKELSYMESAMAETDYWYIVVAYSEANGERYYGNFSYNGIKTEAIN